MIDRKNEIENTYSCRQLISIKTKKKQGRVHNSSLPPLRKLTNKQSKIFIGLEICKNSSLSCFFFIYLFIYLFFVHGNYAIMF